MANPVPNDHSIGAGTLPAEDMAVVEVLEPETLSAEVVSNSK